MKLKEFISQIQYITSAGKIGLFGSSIEKNDSIVPNDIDILLRDCKDLDIEKIVTLGIESGILKSYSIDSYGPSIEVNDQGILDITFFQNNESYLKFLNNGTNDIIQNHNQAHFDNALEYAYNKFIS